MDRIILPIHTNGGTHWVCAMIDIKNKQLVYVDSLVVSGGLGSS